MSRQTPQVSAVLILCSATALAGCEAPPEQAAATENTSHEVKQGTETVSRSEVGRLDLPTGGCTGTLISDRHVLTAAHCANFAGMLAGGNFMVQRRTVADVIARNPAQELHTPVRRTFSFGAGSIGHRDIAVSELERPVPADWATPARIAPSPPGYGSELTMMGYGGAGRTKHYRTYIFTGKESVSENGDSGGPSFEGKLVDKGDIAQVVSYTTDFIFGSRDENAQPAAIRSEIYTLVDALSTSDICYRGYDGDGWTRARCQGLPVESPARGGDLWAFQAWSGRPGVSVCYQAYTAVTNPFGQLTDAGWGPEVCDGAVAGTTQQGFVGHNRTFKTMRMLLVRLRSTGGTRLMATAANSNGWMPAEVDATAGVAMGEPRLGLRGVALRLP